MKMNHNSIRIRQWTQAGGGTKKQEIPLVLLLLACSVGVKGRSKKHHNVKFPETIDCSLRPIGNSLASHL